MTFGNENHKKKIASNHCTPHAPNYEALDYDHQSKHDATHTHTMNVKVFFIIWDSTIT